METRHVCNLPAIVKIQTHNRIEVSKTEAERTKREQYATAMLECAYKHGHCHIACYEEGKSPADVFNELPDYILIKDREFKKDLEYALIKDFGTCKIPFAVYKAVDGNIIELGPFTWLKRSQVRPTRVLTMKY